MSNLVNPDGTIYTDGVLVTDPVEIERIMTKVRRTQAVLEETRNPVMAPTPQRLRSDDEE